MPNPQPQIALRGQMLQDWTQSPEPRAIAPGLMVVDGTLTVRLDRIRVICWWCQTELGVCERDAEALDIHQGHLEGDAKRGVLPCPEIVRRGLNASTTQTADRPDPGNPGAGEEDEGPGGQGAGVPARPRPGRGPLDGAARELPTSTPTESRGTA